MTRITRMGKWFPIRGIRVIRGCFLMARPNETTDFTDNTDGNCFLSVVVLLARPEGTERCFFGQPLSQPLIAGGGRVAGVRVQVAG